MASRTGDLPKIMRISFQIGRIVAAIILVQTLFFKFTGAEESVYLFTKVGAEPLGRIAVFLCSLFVLWTRRDELPVLGPIFARTC